MKTLQNNFTTPEQSKKLLELGLPKDSADCFFMTSNPGEEQFPNIIPIVNDGKICFSLFCDERAVPCWSVGRLIEIIMRCHKHSILFFSSIRIYKTSILDNTLIDYLIEYMPDMDFSKLED